MKSICEITKSDPLLLINLLLLNIYKGLMNYVPPWIFSYYGLIQFKVTLSCITHYCRYTLHNGVRCLAHIELLTR